VYQRERARGRDTKIVSQLSVAIGPGVSEAGSSTPVAWFVDSLAAELGLNSSPADRRTRRLLWRLSEWATGEGLPLDREVILDPDTVERFVVVGLAKDRSRATYRAALRRVGPRTPGGPALYRRRGAIDVRGRR